MKKNNNILYFGVFFAASILAEIYCILYNINIIGVSFVIVIATYLLLDAVRNERTRKEERLEEFLSGHLEEMKKTELSLKEHLNEIEKVQKALYVQLKRSGEEIREQLEEAEKNRQTQTDSVVESQNKSAKIIVKYVRDDIKKATAISKVSSEKITAAVNQSAEKLAGASNKGSADNSSLFQSIDLNISRLISTMEKEAVRLGQVSDSLREEVRDLPNKMASMPASGMVMEQRAAAEVQEASAEKAASLTQEGRVTQEEIPTQEESLPQDELPSSEESLQEELPEPEEDMIPEELPLQRELPPPIKFPSPKEPPVSEELPVPEVVKKPKKSPLHEAVKEVETIIAGKQVKALKEADKTEALNPNKQLNADEIAALFAAASGTAEASEKEPQPEEVLASPVLLEEDVQPEPGALAAVTEDPNRQLSADEIAAMFTAVGGGDGGQQAAAEPVAEVVEPSLPPEIDLSDPNKQLSAEEIAALFASMG